MQEYSQNASSVNNVICIHSNVVRIFKQSTCIDREMCSSLRYSSLVQRMRIVYRSGMQCREKHTYLVQRLL